MLHVDPAPRSGMPPLRAIRAPERACPRYCPERPLPPSRYVPGLYPHPRRDPAGHSYEARPRLRRHPPWHADRWRELTEWRFGVDLFNAFYFWEAHEAWEGLWAVQPRQGPPALLLQGLIQLAAALLKVHLGSLAGARALSREGLDKIAAAAAAAPTLLGLNLRDTHAHFDHYFRPLAERTLPPLDASLPLLLLTGGSDA